MRGDLIGGLLALLATLVLFLAIIISAGMTKRQELQLQIELSKERQLQGKKYDMQ